MYDAPFTEEYDRRARPHRVLSSAANPDKMNRIICLSIISMAVPYSSYNIIWTTATDERSSFIRVVDQYQYQISSMCYLKLEGMIADR